MSIRNRRLADFCFVIFGLLGLVSIGIITYRAGQTERAHFATSVINTYTTPGFLVADHPLSFNVTYTNVGDGAARKVRALGLPSLRDDESTSSENRAIAAFKRYQVADVGEETLQKSQQKYITAYGSVLSEQDIKNVLTGRKVVYVVGDLSFEDDFGEHTQHVCQRIEPILPERQFEIWSDCHQYNSEVDSSR